MGAGRRKRRRRWAASRLPRWRPAARVARGCPAARGCGVRATGRWDRRVGRELGGTRGGRGLARRIGLVRRESGRRLARRDVGVARRGGRRGGSAMAGRDGRQRMAGRLTAVLLDFAGPGRRVRCAFKPLIRYARSTAHIRHARRGPLLRFGGRGHAVVRGSPARSGEWAAFAGHRPGCVAVGSHQRTTRVGKLGAAVGEWSPGNRNIRPPADRNTPSPGERGTARYGDRGAVGSGTVGRLSGG
ncbi:hypothetical protein BC793_11792 [Actinoplanes xinjiangensis]|uniref:Uncharacterized protein n=1 Tax=Actinoplanes xinjiangensis TaxID=512350 RepID=A0A316F5D0_9ACTN|nr:hypothetical protein BC793_11792 [Actinoplanes xinjiangensis]